MKKRLNALIKLYQLIQKMIQHGTTRVIVYIQYHLGYALNCLKRYQEATECCDKALSINPNNDMAWNNKSNEF